MVSTLFFNEINPSQKARRWAIFITWKVDIRECQLNVNFSLLAKGEVLKIFNLFQPIFKGEGASVSERPSTIKTGEKPVFTNKSSPNKQTKGRSQIGERGAPHVGATKVDRANRRPTERE